MTPKGTADTDLETWFNQLNPAQHPQLLKMLRDQMARTANEQPEKPRDDVDPATTSDCGGDFDVVGAEGTEAAKETDSEAQAKVETDAEARDESETLDDKLKALMVIER